MRMLNKADVGLLLNIPVTIKRAYARSAIAGRKVGIDGFLRFLVPIMVRKKQRVHEVRYVCRHQGQTHPLRAALGKDDESARAAHKR